jgi:hypothetical protein
VIDIKHVLSNLSTQRPLFHSEADFQHAFAWEVRQQLLNTASVRLEFPFQLQDTSAHLDIWITSDSYALAIELKYKTHAVSVEVGCETFTLRNQGAQDIGRYDFIKDIQRLEEIIAERPNTIGYAILLTNDKSYWTPQRDSSPVDTDFRLMDGRTFQGELRWGSGASKGTTKDREKPLILRGKYSIRWENYSQPGRMGDNPFRYLAIEVH